MKKIVIIGAGRGGQLIAEMLRQQGQDIVGFADDKRIGEINGIKIIGTTEELEKSGADSFVVGIGMNLSAREKVFEKAVKAGLEPINVIDKTAIIDKSAKIGKGNIIMTGTVIGHFSEIGNNCFIFSNSIVEHNCILKDNVYLSPGVCLAGTVTIEKNTLIGIGAVVKEETRIGMNSIVGAGTVVLENIPNNTVVVGVPAKKLRDNNE